MWVIICVLTSPLPSRSLLHVNFQTSYESVFIYPPFLFVFGLALMKTHQIYWLLCLGINDLWRGIISEIYKAQGLWWALNSSSAVSADSLAQKGKKNKLSRAWFCWEHCWESWEGQGGLGSKAHGGRGMRVGNWAFGHWAILSVTVGHQWLLQLGWPKATWFEAVVIWRCHCVSLKLN